MNVTAIIAAGGRGQRFGGGVLKQLVGVGGRPILERAVTAFLSHPAIHEVIVALPAELLADPPAYLCAAPKPCRLVAGGVRRQDSVRQAFQVASERSDLIVIHDAARPFASADLIARTIEAAAEGGAALAAVTARDTVKRGALAAGRSGPDGVDAQLLVVAETLPRDSIYLAQTPQAFRRDVLRDGLALGEAGADATDEATLAERAGHTVRLVEGEATNIKITTPGDLLVAEAIARGSPERAAGERAGFRIGAGYDLHRLVEGRLLVLGGVNIPFERGLLGHSDADAICHAVTDAVLGAAAAGDIGRHFPDADPKWRDWSSIDLLRRAAAIVHADGYAIANVDVVVIAERPKLAPFLDQMRANVANAIGVAIGAVGIKGKTNEGLGELGRGEAIAVHAVALIVRN
ncbi:MAG TPA: 2-C-methyl-D-erythritol 4-phosphate cytidylyltransferase [Vicinamibacterales bacterium]|nr:2-C-methyl-D-erythritol 4-phosphate cytidylyltransferase [Vicinamibacterales bacterium]